jgi:NET1-associated nuclear protein 1 (U3 small nucleolar RNA-associated protein 17)
MLISQTNTGNRQFVPRLGAQIIAISQSKSGSLYSVSLSNNKIKIINAADLELKSEISGIQSQRLQKPPQVRQAVTLHPQRRHLYLSRAPGTIQSYDIQLDQEGLSLAVAPITHIKQTGKEKRQVLEPSVTFVSMTSNGNWLATVDEWSNPYAVEDVVTVDVCLKFWAWKGKQWELVTKIQGPHEENRLLGLASPTDMSKEEFATLGAEGLVKIWRPLEGVYRSSTEIIWSLCCTVGSTTSSIYSQGALIYSLDNSLLLMGIGNDIFIAAVASSQIVRCLHMGQPISQLAVLGRHVLCLHDDSSLISAWDLANGQVIFTDRIDRGYATIAVNHATSTFALASSSGSKSTIVISSIEQARMIEEGRISLNSTVTGLLSSEPPTDVPEYISVDESGNIVVISTEPVTGETAVDMSPTTTNTQVQTLSSGDKNTSANQIKHVAIDEISHILSKGKLDLVHMYEAIVQRVS